MWLCAQVHTSNITLTPLFITLQKATDKAITENVSNQILNRWLSLKRTVLFKCMHIWISIKWKEMERDIGKVKFAILASSRAMYPMCLRSYNLNATAQSNSTTSSRPQVRSNSTAQEYASYRSILT